MKSSKWLVLLALLALACSKEKETPKGYKYTLVRKGDGNVPPPGKFLRVDLVFRDAKDSVWNDTRKSDFPLIIPVRDTSFIRMEEGLDEVFRLLSKGDSIVMKLNAQTFFEKSYRQPVPPGVDPKSDFTFEVVVKDVLDTAAVNNLHQEVLAKQEEKAKAQREEQLAKDIETIDSFLKEKNISAQTTASGLRYIVTKQGTGANAKPGQTATVNYAGYLMNGKYFDTSYEKLAKEQNVYMEGRTYEPYKVVVATRSVIEGWDEMLQLMNKGSKVTVYVPSSLGYGPRKVSEDIGENAILIFDMEMVDLQ